MKVGIENLPLAQLLAFPGLRLLDLHDHLTALKNLRCLFDDRGPGAAVTLIVGADAEPCVGFDPDLVSASHQFLGALGRQSDAVFAVLRFARAADQHQTFSSAPPVTRARRGGQSAAPDQNSTPR